MNFARSKLRGIKPKAIRIHIRSKLRGITPVEIKALENDGAPPYVINNAWAQYDDAFFEYGRLRIKLIGGEQRERVPADTGSLNLARRITQGTSQPNRQLGQPSAALNEANLELTSSETLAPISHQNEQKKTPPTA